MRQKNMIEKIERYIVYIFNFRKINKMADALVRVSNIEEMTDKELKLFILEEENENTIKNR